MLRSLSSGVTGVNANQTLLDVVGNNIANSNTPAFKRSIVNFQELMSQTRSSGTAPTAERGGINPQQIGLGTSVGSITVDQTNGNINYTGTKSDMAIDGDGYFILRNGTTNIYSRAGNFIKDGNGNLVQRGTGYKLLGFKMYDDPLNPGSKITGTDLSDVIIPTGQKLAAKPTSTVGFKCNLNSEVDTVLPMGLNAKDMTFSGEINGTKYSSITFAEGPDPAHFLNMTLTDDSGTSTTIPLALSGVNATSGLPSLVQSGGPYSLGNPASAVTVSFDDATGQVSISDTATGKGLWSGDIGPSMNYEVLELDDGAGNKTPYLVEFNDEADGGRTINVWGDNGATPSAMALSSASLGVNNDGTFNIPTGTPATLTLGAAGASPVTLNIAATSSEKGISLSDSTSGSTLDTINMKTASTHNTKYDIYDSQGNGYTLETSWEKVDNNTWRWRTWCPNNENIDINNNTGLVMFSPDGLVESVVDANGGDTSAININFGSLGAGDATIQLDFTGKTLGKDPIDAVTQFGSGFTTKEYYQDGYAMGILNNYSVGSDGVVKGIYSNGQTEDLFTVGLAVFSNSSGLEKMGEGAYRSTSNSGIPQIVKPDEGGAGKIAGSSLEDSNVNLTSEFVNLIKGQRGFQASARVITTSDQVLEELMNIKR